MFFRKTFWKSRFKSWKNQISENDKRLFSTVRILQGKCALLSLAHITKRIREYPALMKLQNSP